MKQTEVELKQAQGEYGKLVSEKNLAEDELQACKCDLIKANNEAYKLKAQQQNEFDTFSTVSYFLMIYFINLHQELL